MIDQGSLKPVQFKPGDVLFNEGEQSYHFFIVQEGEVEIYRTSDDGQVIPLAFVGAGSSIGEFAMIDRLPRSATARAKTKVSAVEVSEAAYQQLLAELPDWAVSVMRALVERLRNTNEIIRKSKLIDPVVQTQIDSAEYDPDASKVTTIDDDLPDLA